MGYIGNKGFVYLWKLCIIGVETEEILAPLTCVLENNKPLFFDIAIGSDMLKLPIEEQKQTVDKSPVKKEELFKHWEEWKKPVVAKYQKRNERLFDRETERINRFYDDYALKVEDKIRRLENEKKEINRKKDNSSDFEERRKYQKRLQDIDITLGKLNLQVYKEKSEGEEKREKELKQLQKKLDLKFKEKLIAITHFELK